MADKTLTGIVTWLKNWFPLKSELGAVATSNNYNDLDNKPNIPSGVVVDTEMSSTSTNAVQNKVIQSALNGKANSSHTHTKSQITDFPTSMTPSSHTHGNLQNNGQVGSTAQANKNVVTNSSGLITTEDKPTIPIASTTVATADHYKNTGVIGTSTEYARADHQHTHVNFICVGTTGSAGYIKLFQLKINAKYQDHPISFDIEQRNTNKDAHISIRFANVSNNDPALDSITHYGYNGDYYLYKESTSTWSFIILKKDNYDSVQVSNLVSGMGGISITKVDEQISALPSGYVQSTYTIGGASFGTSVNTVCEGNDSRLSDNRNPLSNNLAPTSTNLVDLDNVRGTGFYYALGDANIKYVSNLPSNWGNTSFYLTVEETNNTTYCKQTITSYDGDKMFVRIRWGGGWSVWKSYLSSNDIVDNLTSTSSTSVLSARQGKVLKDSLVWQTQTLTNMSGCTLYYNDLFCVLEVDGSYTIRTANAYTNLVTGTIPSNLRPNVNKTELNDGSVLIRLRVNTDGAIQYFSPQTFSSSAGIHVEFIWKR